MVSDRFLIPAVFLALAGCGATAGTDSQSRIPAAVLAQARPIGRGARFHPPVRGPIVGRCQPRLGPRSGVHVEVFAANRVVIVPAAIGTRAPRRYSAGRISAARCFGGLVTTEPTGLVLVRTGRGFLLGDLFRSWGQPLSSHRLAGFLAGPGRTVRAYVNGVRQTGPPAHIPLGRHAEIVLEVGPFVPPHGFYTFPPGT